MEEESRDPQDGSLQLLQVEEEIIPVLNRQQVIVVPLQDAGVKGGQVGLPADVFGVDFRGGKVAAEDKVSLVDFWATVAASQDSAVAHHRAYAVMLVVDRRGVWEQGFKVVADGEDILVAGVVKVHQLANTHTVLCEGEVGGNVDIVEDIFPVNRETLVTRRYRRCTFIYLVACCLISVGKLHLLSNTIMSLEHHPTSTQ